MGDSIKLLAFSKAGPADIVKLALPMTLTEFAVKHGFTKAEVSQCLSGYRLHEKVRSALSTEIGVPRAEVDALLAREAA